MPATPQPEEGPSPSFRECSLRHTYLFIALLITALAAVQALQVSAPTIPPPLARAGKARPVLAILQFNLLPAPLHHAPHRLTTSPRPSSFTLWSTSRGTQRRWPGSSSGRERCSQAAASRSLPSLPASSCA